ncbi:MAG: hypothetical protein KGI67_08850 [Pseudomonadota bacterium]|nr:hypothetical protein [Pseudomonadota bacterium]
MASRKQSASRQHLAYLAARMMAENGVPDCTSARRKLARQLGIAWRDLPDDREITAELRSFQALYQADSQHLALQRLRSTAVQAMEMLAAYDPWLVGGVLSGTAGPHSEVQLQLYTDRDKELQMFLLGQQIPCRFRERQVHLGGRQAQIPVVDLDFPGGHVEASVFSEQDLRAGARPVAANGPLTRARLDKVRELLREAS